jgi:hypothetical protein
MAGSTSRATSRSTGVGSGPRSRPGPSWSGSAGRMASSALSVDRAAGRRNASSGAALAAIVSSRCAVRPRHLDAYLDQFVFRFNRKNLPRGFLFRRLVEQALRTPQIPTRKLYLNVPVRHVQPIYSVLEHRGFSIVISGGWAVDGVTEQVIRVHGDLDLLVPTRFLQAARRYLVDAGYLPVKVGEGDRHQYVDDEHGLAVSLHPVEMQRSGSAVETLPDGRTFEYRLADLGGQGIFDGYSLQCVTAEAQLRRRLLDRERDEERHDLRVLRRVVAGELPLSHPQEEEEPPKTTEQDEVVSFLNDDGDA